MSKKFRINEVDLTRDFRYDDTDTARSLGYSSSQSLTGWWKFEELAAIVENDTLIYDYATGNNHGVYHGLVENISFDSAPGNASAAHLPVGVYTQFPDLGTLGMVGTDISFAAWIKVVNDEVNILLLGNNKVQIAVTGGLFTLRLGTIEGDDVTSFVLKDRVQAPGVITPDTWYHIAYSYNSVSFENTFYLNGEKIGTYEEEVTYASTDIMRFPHNVLGTYPEIVVSDLSTWSSELESHEIKAIYSIYSKMYAARSGFMGYPAKVALSELDNSPGAYPTIHRADDDIGFGSDLSRPYDDSKTVIFDSAYANAWIQFYGRPRDASTITLHDPAGSIDLLPATAHPRNNLDDLTVSANGELKVEQVYQVFSYNTNPIELIDTVTQVKTNDYPTLSGAWTGIKNVKHHGENIILESPNDDTNPHEDWIGADEEGLVCKVTVTKFGAPDPEDGATDDYISEFETYDGTLVLEANYPGVEIVYTVIPSTSGDYPAGWDDGSGAPIITVTDNLIDITIAMLVPEGSSDNLPLLSNIVNGINNHEQASVLVSASFTGNDAPIHEYGYDTNWPTTATVIGTSYVGEFKVELYKNDGESPVEEPAGVPVVLENLLMDSEEQFLNDLAASGEENTMFDGIKISWPNPYNSDGGADTDSDGVIVYNQDITGDPTGNDAWTFRLSPPDKFVWRKANLENYSGANAWSDWYPNEDGQLTGQFIGAGNVRREYVLKSLKYSKADEEGCIISDPYPLNTIDNVSGSIPDNFSADVYVRGDLSSSSDADPNWEEEYYKLYFSFDRNEWHAISSSTPDADFSYLKDAQKSPYNPGASDGGTYEYSPYVNDNESGDEYAGRWAGPVAYAPFADGHKFTKTELQHVPKDASGEPLYDSMPDLPHLENWPNGSSHEPWPSVTSRAWSSDNPAYGSDISSIPSYMMYQEARDAGLISQSEVDAYIALGNQLYSGGVKTFRKIRYMWNNGVDDKNSSEWKIFDGSVLSSSSYSDDPNDPDYICNLVYPESNIFSTTEVSDDDYSTYYKGNTVYQLSTDRYDTDEYGPTQLYFKVEIGPKVSWGRCQIKVAANFAGRFWHFDDIDNDTADGNNIRLSWENFTGHGRSLWTINVEDSTKETFEFNRGRIVNPANTAVNIRKLRDIDQVNDAFARAVNNSGLQIVAKSDGKKVLLTQTMPGSVGNLEIHADRRSRCFISNSKLFNPGSKGEVTGSFSGGDNYLVSYPTLLPAPVHMSDPEGSLLYSSEAGHVSSARMAGMNESPYSLDSKGNKLWTDDTGLIFTTNDIETPWEKKWIRYFKDASTVPPGEDVVATYEIGANNESVDISDATYFELYNEDPDTTGETETDYMQGLGYTRASLAEDEWLEYEGLTNEVYIESPWLNHRIMSPNSQSLDSDRGIIEAGLIATGACVKGVSDVLLNFDSPVIGSNRHFEADPLNPQALHSDYSATPFVDNKIDIDIENDFYDEGTSREVYEGLSSPLKSKTQVIIDLETVSPTTLGYDVRQKYVNNKVQGVGFRSYKFSFLEEYGHKWRLPNMSSITLSDELQLTGESKNYFVFFARGDIDGRSKNPSEEVFKIKLEWEGEFSGQNLWVTKADELKESRFFRYRRYITTGSLGGTGYTDANGDNVPESEATYLDGDDRLLNTGYTLEDESTWLENNYPDKYELAGEYICVPGSTDPEDHQAVDINLELGGPDQGLSPRRKGPYSYFDFGNPHAVIVLPPGVVKSVECTPGTEVDYGVNQVFMRVWPKAYSFGPETAVEPNRNKTKLFNNMAYYNFKTKEWDEVGPGITTQPNGKEGHIEFFEDACIGFSRGMELIQTGTRAGALPITNFGFPSHPKFTASDDQWISMDKFIVRPFILEKFVLEYDAAWAEGKDHPKRTIMYDVTSSGTLSRSDDDGNFNNKAAINSFFILNQRDWTGPYDYDADGQSVTRWGKPHYGRNVTHDSDDNAKNRYMWNGNDYPYTGKDNLICWYRFNDSGDLFNASYVAPGTSAPTLLYDDYSYVDYTNNDTIVDAPAQASDSPWELPDGVDTTEFNNSIELYGNNFLRSTLSEFVTSWQDFSSSMDNFHPYGIGSHDGDTVLPTPSAPAVDRLYPPQAGWTYGAEWRYISTEGNYDVDLDEQHYAYDFISDDGGTLRVYNKSTSNYTITFLDGAIEPTSFTEDGSGSEVTFTICTDDSSGETQCTISILADLINADLGGKLYAEVVAEGFMSNTSWTDPSANFTTNGVTLQYPAKNVKWIRFADRPDGTSFAPGNWSNALVFHNDDLKESGVPAPISGSFARYNVAQSGSLYFSYMFAQASAARYTFRNIIDMGHNESIDNPSFGHASGTLLFDQWRGWLASEGTYPQTREAIINYLSDDYWYVTATDRIVPSGSAPTTWGDAVASGWVTTEMYTATITDEGLEPDTVFPYGHLGTSTSAAPWGQCGDENNQPDHAWYFNTTTGKYDDTSMPTVGTYGYHVSLEDAPPAGPGLTYWGLIDEAVEVEGVVKGIVTLPDEGYPSDDSLDSQLGKYIPCVGTHDADDEVLESYIQDDRAGDIYTILPQLNEPPDTWRRSTTAFKAFGKKSSLYSGYGSEALRLQISKTHLIDIDDESPTDTFVDKFEPDKRWRDVVVHEPDYTKQGTWQSHAMLIDPKKYFGQDYTGTYFLRFYQEGATYPDAWSVTDIYTKESFTLSFWFKVKSISRGWSNLLTIAAPSGAPNKIWIAFRRDELRMAVDTGDNRIKTIARVPKNLGMEKGGWHHIVFSFDQSSRKCRFYADGELLITYEIPQKTNGRGDKLWKDGTSEVTSSEIDNPYDGTRTFLNVGTRITPTEEQYMASQGYAPALPWEFNSDDLVVFGADVDKLTWKLAVAKEKMTGASQWLQYETPTDDGYTLLGDAESHTTVDFQDAYGNEAIAIDDGMGGTDYVSWPTDGSAGPGAQGWEGLKFDNYFNGFLSDIAVWDKAINGLCIKGLYHLHQGGYYKKGLDTDISLSGNLPFRFDVPLDRDFTIRSPSSKEDGYDEFVSPAGGDSLVNYNISHKLLARYLSNPNEFDKIESADYRDTSIRNNLTGIIIGNINYAEDSPWIPPLEPADIYIPDGFKFSIDFEDDIDTSRSFTRSRLLGAGKIRASLGPVEAHIKLPRAKDFFTPQEITQVSKGTVSYRVNLLRWWLGRNTRSTITRDSYTPETFDAYPAFSVFAWIKIPDEQTVTDPVIFAINDKNGANRLMFYIDTADRPGSGDSGDRLSLYVKTDRIDDTYFTDLPDDYSDGSTNLDDVAGTPDIDRTRAGRYSSYFVLSTAKFANPQIAADEDDIKTLRDGKWHFVGFTYEPGNSVELDDDDNPLYGGSESTWEKEYQRQIYEPKYVDIPIKDSVLRIIAGTMYLEADPEEINVVISEGTLAASFSSETLTIQCQESDSAYDIIEAISAIGDSYIEAILYTDAGDAWDSLSEDHASILGTYILESNTRKGLGNYKIYIDGEAQELFKQTRVSVRGPLNDIWLYDFDSGLDPQDPSSTAFNRKGDAWENTHDLRDYIEDVIENRFGVQIEFGEYEKYQWLERDPSDDVGYSNLHKSLKFDELDRLSIGQEYDVRRWKNKYTGRTYRYRTRSQIFNGQMADITMWSEGLDSNDVKVLYNTRFGTNDVTKWFNQFTATSRDLVTFGQWSIYAGITESSSDINELLEQGLSREVTTLASMPSSTYDEDGLLEDHDGDPNSEMIVSGSYVMEGIIKRPVRHEHGLAYKLGTKAGPYGYRSIYKTTHSGVRSGLEKDLSSSRTIFNSVPGTDSSEPAEDFGREIRGRDSTPLRIFEEGKEESPYILYPTDKLVFGWQAAQPYDFKQVSGGGIGPHLSIAPGASEELPVNMKITLYGSYLSDGKESHDPLNQKLTSNNIHESLQFETPVHDVFHLECAGYLAGTHRDDIVSGSIFIKERNQESAKNNITRRKVAAISEGNQGITGSMLHGVRLVDSRERFYDTVVAAPADYHEFNGNGVLEWRHPLFDNNRLQRSMVFGEPRPSDQKVILPEKTIIRCREDGWYEPLPQGVIKLTFSRLWTADYFSTSQSISVKNIDVQNTSVTDNNDVEFNDDDTWEHENPSSNQDEVSVGIDAYPNTDTYSVGNIYWYIEEVPNDKWAYGKGWIHDGEGTQKGPIDLWYVPDGDDEVDPVSTITHAYEYVPHNAGVNYMFSTGGAQVSDPEVITRETYFSIYDANGDHWVVWLDWGGVDKPDVSSNIITVDMGGWQDGSNGWESGNPEDVAGDGVTTITDTDRESWVNASSFYAAIGDQYDGVNNIDAWVVAEINDLSSSYNGTATDTAPTAASFVPSDSYYMTSAVFANKVAEAIHNTTGFEVLGKSQTDFAFGQDDISQQYSIYIRTSGGGLTAANPDDPESLLEGGGLPGVHYAPPTIDTSWLYTSYYKYMSIRGGIPIAKAEYSFDDLGYDGVLASNNWGVSRPISDHVVITEGVGDTSSFTDDDVDWLGIANALGFHGDGNQGIQDYVERIKPNNPTQFLRQMEVIEEKSGFSRVSDYTIDGAYFQIHDAKDVAYNVWYVLDDGDSSLPASPSTEGTLIRVDTIPPGSPAAVVARSTFEYISGSEDLRDNFNVYYNEGDEFFTIENVQDGSTKDMDSSIMGLPTTTGFYLTDEDGMEYDNEFSYIFPQWGGIFGSYSFSRISADQETYAGGRTPEDPEVFWQGDPIQEGIDPYHKHTNALIDAYWLGSFPFESRYASLRRRRWIKDDKKWIVTTWDQDTGEFSETSKSVSTFTTAIITGSNIPTQMTDPAMDDGTETYQVLTVISDGSPNIENSNLYRSGKTRNNFFKFYFGAGNTWQKNPEIQDEFIDSDGYSWPSAVPKIRGWKYGLKSALPENSSAVFRHDNYGQFRDMLEQRSFSRFFKQSRGRSQMTVSPVIVRFVDQNGLPTQPSRTWSQNLSRFCTSSLPFFDDAVPRNREHPLDEDEINTSIIAVGE